MAMAKRMGWILLGVLIGAVWRASRVLRICYLTGRKESDIPHIDSEVARELRSVPRRALW